MIIHTQTLKKLLQEMGDARYIRLRVSAYSIFTMDSGSVCKQTCLLSASFQDTPVVLEHPHEILAWLETEGNKETTRIEVHEDTVEFHGYKDSLICVRFKEYCRTWPEVTQ